MLEHGTRSMYNTGCRCPSCTYANSSESAAYGRRVRREAKAYRELAKRVREAEAQHETV